LRAVTIAKARTMKRTFIAGLVCIIAGVVLLIALVALPWGSDSSVNGMMGDLDRHFIEQMIPHHEDAVGMAELALVKAEHPELRQLAENIRKNQSQEIAQMRAWYESWYDVEAPKPGTGFQGSGMGMMGMGMMGGGTDLEVLEVARPFDQEFINQMIPHHQMALMMAQMVLSGSDRKEIQDLARSIIQTQSAEIEQMRSWYRSWYGG
jgi:uncharacterized protein (DUF305 family)